MKKNKYIRIKKRLFIFTSVILGIFTLLILFKFIAIRINPIKYTYCTYHIDSETYYAMGKIGNYPILITSKDKQVWYEMYPKGRKLILPLFGSYYRNLEAVGNTIWVSEDFSRGSGEIYPPIIWYSHDKGEKWQTVPLKYLDEPSYLLFYDENYGELYGESLYVTENGGKTWEKRTYNESRKYNKESSFVIYIQEYSPFVRAIKSHEMYSADSTKTEIILPTKYSTIKKFRANKIHACHPDKLFRWLANE